MAVSTRSARRPFRLIRNPNPPRKRDFDDVVTRRVLGAFARSQREAVVALGREAADEFLAECLGERE